MSCLSPRKLPVILVLFAAAACGSVAANDPPDAATDLPDAAVGSDANPDASPDAPPAMVTLAISRVGDRTGTVTSTPAGIDCGADCTLSLPAGTQLTLHAEPASSAQFAGWSGGGCSGTDDCTLTVTTDVTVTAQFDPAIHLVTVTPTGTGSGTITSTPAGIDCGSDCTEGYPDLSPITLTATPASGSTFLGWAGGGCAGTAPCAITVTAPITVQAAFVKDNALVVSKLGNGTGTVTGTGISCGSDCSETYSPGTTVTLTASAGTGSTFTGWGGACSGTGTCTVTMDAAKMVTATFTLLKYTLTVGHTGTGSGTITSNPAGIECGNDCSQSYDYNTIVKLTAKPNPGTLFAGWSGACQGTSTCTVTMTAARSVTATFQLRGTFYTIRQTDDMLRRLDPQTLQYTDIGTLGVDYSYGDCAWNTTNNTLYMVPYTAQVLYRVSTTTGVATAVGTHGIAQLRSLAFHPPTGRLYTVNTAGQLYYLNPSTGAATFVGTPGIPLDGLAWDSQHSRMIGLQTSVAGGSLYTINLTTGAATALAAAGSINNAGLAYDPVLDHFWADDSAGALYEYDPAASWTRTAHGGSTNGNQTCITFRP